MTLTAPKFATYADLLALPEHVVGEILDGELVVSPRPAPRHARASSLLGMDLAPFQFRRKGGSGPGGWQILDEPELHFGRNVMVPDLAGWTLERLPRLPDTAWFELAPDWVCEVVSPSSARIDRVRKMPKYAAEGVAWLWLVDPLAQTLDAFRLHEGSWLLLGSWGGGAVARVQPFDAIELDLTGWWQDPEPAEVP